VLANNEHCFSGIKKKLTLGIPIHQVRMTDLSIQSSQKIKVLLHVVYSSLSNRNSFICKLFARYTARLISLVCGDVIMPSMKYARQKPVKLENVCLNQQSA
jgi:hypothetical protein